MGLNIWCISKYALPPKYGAQHRLFKLSKWFNKLGHNSIVIASNTNHLVKESLIINSPKRVNHIDIEGVPSYFLKGMLILNSNSLRRVLSWFYFEIMLFSFILGSKSLGLKKPDVVIVSSLSLFTILNGILMKVIYNAKLVFEIRDIWPLTAILITKKSKYHPLMVFMRWVEKIGYRYSDLISSPLPNLKEHIEDSIRRPFNFLYVPQGFEPDLSDQEMIDKAFVDKYIPKGKFIVVYIGNIAPAYDFDTMIKVVERIQKNNFASNIHFLVVGDGTYKDELILKTKHLNNITFAPKVSKNQIVDMLNYCDVATNYLKPEYLFKFGVAPQKIIDYFMAKKPVIMSYTGYPSIVNQANAGAEIPSGDIESFALKIIDYYLMDKKQLKSIGENGYNFLINNLSWINLSQLYLGKFRTL